MKVANFLCYSRCKAYLHRYFTFLELPRLHPTIKRHYFTTVIKSNVFTSKQPLLAMINKRFNHDDHELELVEDTKQVNEVYEEIYEEPLVVRHILYPSSNDELMKKINDCMSIEEALGIIKEYKDMLTACHLTQAVLTFWDLQKMYYHVNILRSNSYVNEAVFDKMNYDYTRIIFENDVFKAFLNTIDSNRSTFNTEQLSYIILYLKKMGYDIKDILFQNLVIEFNKKFSNEKFSLEKLSRYMVALFKKNDLSFYYATQQYLPEIYRQIEEVASGEDVRLLTICLSTVNVLVSNETLLKYKKKIYELIIKGVLNHTEYKSIIRIVMFLNYPHWRFENSRITCDCLKLLRGHLHLLNINEILTVHDVFYKVQEPGDILNELQRCASRYLLQLEEELSPLLDIRLKLSSCVMYFMSPSQRLHFHKTIRKYLDYNLDANSILELHKIVLFTKTNDVNLCRSFWNKLLTHLNDENFTKDNLLRVCRGYISFEEITNTFRHVQCENKLLEFLEKELRFGLLGMIPSHFSSIAGFILIYSHNKDTLRIVIERIEEFSEQFNIVDCLNLSQSIAYAKIENKLLSHDDIQRINTVLENRAKSLSKKTTSIDAFLLLKGSVSRGTMQDYSHLWGSFDENLSSRLMKGISDCLQTTMTLIPNIIDLLSDYIVRNRADVLGFNVERVLYLCFNLAYTPKNSEQFFKQVIDILIRDQERMTGLSYLHSCLALAFFNVLPQSFIKQIFNEEFLEKLDLELENCYFKDVYPLRVRQCMMQLNRAVCLDYPEANVPWFHQKYVDNYISKSSKKTSAMHNQTLTESLLQLAKYKNIIKKGVILPYGYHADFVVYLDKNRNLTDEEKAAQKLAVLVLSSKAYTNGVVQLRGNIQMKIRHLEMFGYKVCTVNLNEWKTLIYGQDRIEYINEILGLRDVDLNADILRSR